MCETQQIVCFIETVTTRETPDDMSKNEEGSKPKSSKEFTPGSVEEALKRHVDHIGSKSNESIFHKI